VPGNFTLSATLVTTDGAQASAMTGGSLVYEVGSCTNGVCDFHLHSLSGQRGDIAGTVYEATGGSYGYELQGLDFQSTAPLEGSWYQSSGRVVFPGQGLSVLVQTDDILLNDVSVGVSGDTVVYLNQIVGELDVNTQGLSLSASFQSGDSSVSMVLGVTATGTEICGCVSNTCDQSCGDCPEVDPPGCFSLCD